MAFWTLLIYSSCFYYKIGLEFWKSHKLRMGFPTRRWCWMGKVWKSDVVMANDIRSRISHCRVEKFIPIVMSFKILVHKVRFHTFVRNETKNIKTHEKNVIGKKNSMLSMILRRNEDEFFFSFDIRELSGLVYTHFD